MKYQKIIILVMTYILIASVAHSGNLNFIPYGKSIHLADENVEYNEENWSIGFQYDFGSINDRWIKFITVAGFVDSMNVNSYYAGCGFARRFMISDRLKYLHVDTGFVTLLMTREDYNDNKPFPVILPLISIGTYKIAVNSTFIPKIDEFSSAVLFFQLKIKI